MRIKTNLFLFANLINTSKGLYNIPINRQMQQTNSDPHPSRFLLFPKYFLNSVQTKGF